MAIPVGHSLTANGHQQTFLLETIYVENSGCRRCSHWYSTTRRPTSDYVYISNGPASNSENNSTVHHSRRHRRNAPKKPNHAGLAAPRRCVTKSGHHGLDGTRKAPDSG